MFAIATRLKSQRNLSFGFGDLLPETALARHGVVGGQAGCPCIGFRERQVIEYLGPGPEEHFVRRLSAKRRMRHLGVVLGDVEFDSARTRATVSRLFRKSH